jgi:predicted ferric reductase
MAINVLDLSAYVGLTAVGAVTLNMFLGTLMAFRYSPLRSWPHRKFNYFRWHTWFGYIALSASVLHPLVLLLNHSPRFTLTAIVYPVHSPGKPVENTFGALALCVITTVVITSYFRIRLGRRLWKAFHFSIYFGAAALFFHSLLTTADLKNEPIDWLDGGKLFIVGCLVLVTATGLLRWRYSRARTKEAIPALPGVGALD